MGSVNKSIRAVVLPEWLRECEDFCDSCLTKPTPRGKAADMWIEHGSDMVLKIRQLMAENDTLREHLVAVCEGARAAIFYPEKVPDSIRAAEAYLDSTKEKGKENPT